MLLKTMMLVPRDTFALQLAASYALLKYESNLGETAHGRDIQRPRQAHRQI
jgi:hypothetical protein